jgi:hypothetical protein
MPPGLFAANLFSKGLGGLPPESISISDKESKKSTLLFGGLAKPLF